MSTPAYDSQMQPRAQEEDLNDRAWNEVVTTKLPANLEEQARLHKAWSRKRGVSSVSDLLRALLVYACCSTPTGNGNVGSTQRDWFALGAGMAQTARAVTALDCMVAFGILRSPVKGQLGCPRE